MFELADMIVDTMHIQKLSSFGYLCVIILYFSTLEDCRATCEGKIDICELPITTGPCSSSFTRWAYDPHISSCREFRYSGCLGNFNRFE